MIVIALGANLPSRAGAPLDTLKAALARLAAQGVHVASVSSYYLTKAWPDPADPDFVNAVARIETTRSPRELMELLHATEAYFGRTRGAKNAPRIAYETRGNRLPREMTRSAVDTLQCSGCSHFGHP